MAVNDDIVKVDKIVMHFWLSIIILNHFSDKIDLEQL